MKRGAWLKITMIMLLFSYSSVHTMLYAQVQDVSS